jgi:hypothetical protein
MKKLSISILILLLSITFVGCGNTSPDSYSDTYNDLNNYNEATTPDLEQDKVKSKSLTDGFWIADYEHNPNDDLELDYGNDYGFVFKNDSDGEFDGTALTTAQHAWKYSVTDDNIVEIYRYYSSEETYKLMFSGTYDKKYDVLNLSFSSDAEDYFDTMESNSSVILTHVEDNEIMEKLIFETWSTVNYESETPLTDGFKNADEYDDFRDNLHDIDSNVELYKFYYNYKEFDMSDGNGKETHYNDDSLSWKYTAFTYELKNDSSQLEITKYGDYDNTCIYIYDKNMNKLTLDSGSESEVIYRITDFTS